MSCELGPSGPHPALPREPRVPAKPASRGGDGGGKRGQRGQALIETAITLPIMIALFLGFLAVGLAVQGAVDLNTAVYLATASAVTAPANAPATGQAYARATYGYTVQHFNFLADTGQSISCTGSWTPGTPVRCSAQAKVLLSSTFGIVPDLQLSATASATVPAYRSE